MAGVIIICIVGLFYTQEWINRKALSDAKKQNSGMLNITATTVDSYLAQAYNSANMLMYNSYIRNFILQPPIESGSKDIQVLIDAQQQLPKVHSLNPLLLDQYIYSTKNGYLICAENVFLDLDKIYPLIAFDNLNSGQWKKKYLQYEGSNKFFPSTIAKIDDIPYKVIPYIFTYPLSNPSSNRGKIIQLLDASLIENMLNSFDIGTHGWYCITDTNGTNIIDYNINFANGIQLKEGASIETNDQGEKFLVSTYTSSISKLSYTSAISYSELISRQSPIQFILPFIIILTLLLSCIFLFYMAYSRQKSLNHLLQTIHLKEGETFSYETIAHLIEMIVKQDSNELKQIGGMQYMTETLFRRIIQGKPLTPEMIKYIINDNNLIDNSNIVMAKIRLNGAKDLINLDDINFSRIAANNEAKNKFGENYFFYMDLDFNFWFITWNEKPHEIRNLFYRFYEIFKKICPYDSSIGLSAEFNSMSDIIKGPEQCNLVINRMLDEKIIYELHTYKELEMYKDDYKYTKNEEKNLIHAVEKRDLLLVKEILSNIFEENYKKRYLSIQANNQFLKALYTTVADYEFRHLNKSFPRVFQSFIEVEDYFIALASSEYKKNKQEKEEELISKIVKYISLNYGDINLNLSMMSSSLQLKENYLYHFMSTRMNKTFAQFLESYRLEKAQEKIKINSNITLKQISQDCGYSNPQTFRRAFKKYFGNLPSDLKYKRGSLDK